MRTRMSSKLQEQKYENKNVLKIIRITMSSNYKDNNILKFTRTTVLKTMRTKMSSSYKNKNVLKLQEQSYKDRNVLKS